MTTPVLTVDHLGAGYGDLRVVWDVSLQVEAGTVTALLGRNGAGKTTTLRAVAGLNRIGAGSIRFDGEDVSHQATHRRIRHGMALVQEGKRVFHRRSVEENLLLGAYVLGRGRRRLPAELERVYTLFPMLADMSRARAGALSGGQQQMLAIGQALMAGPRLLMLDEPSGGLAPAIVADVMQKISELKETGLAILLVEQAVEAAVSVADHVVVIDVGRIVLEGPAAGLDDLEVIKNAYFGRL
jgi:branched-chain amino acid transport system ATP-binding protein